MKIADHFAGGLQKSISTMNLIYDYHKHVTTLSLGAILFISAFLKNSKNGETKEVFIVLSIIAFLLSVIFSLGIMKHMQTVINNYATMQTYAGIMDSGDVLDAEKQKEHIIKTGKQIEELIAKSAKEIEPVRKKISRAWYAFLAGVVLAICFILSPIVARLWKLIIK